MNSAPALRATTGQCYGFRAREAPGLPGDPHPAHLVGDHVEVADHEAHDLHELVRQPEPLEAGEQVVRLGGGRQRQAGEDAERALGQQRPRRHEPGLR